MRCKDCEYVKCYAVNKKMYYCDNRNRVNLMGKLGEDNYLRQVQSGVQWLTGQLMKIIWLRKDQRSNGIK